MMKILSLFFIVVTVVANDFKTNREIRSPGGIDFQGSNSFATHLPGSTRSSGSWNSPASSGRSNGVWGNSNRGRASGISKYSDRYSASSRTGSFNRHNSNGISDYSGYGPNVRNSNGWDNSFGNFRSTW